MDPATLSALILSVITALGVLSDRILKNLKHLKSSCCGASLDIDTRSEKGETSSQRVERIVENIVFRMSQTQDGQQPSTAAPITTEKGHAQQI